MPGLHKLRLDPTSPTSMEGNTSDDQPAALKKGKAQSLEILDKTEVFVPIKTGLLPAASLDHLEKVSPMKPFLTRNRSFDDKWRSFQLAAEGMDFVDDSDTWSQASYDSTCSQSTTGDPPTPGITHQNRRGFSLSAFSRMSENDEMKAKNEINSLQEKQEKQGRGKGLSHSMVMNWLLNKKYPAIAESNDENCLSPVEGITPGTKGADMIEATTAKLTQVNLANLDVQTGLPKEGTAVAPISVPPPTTTPVKKFTFRDLNAVSPSYF